jgi:hypothetical protein
MEPSRDLRERFDILFEPADGNGAKIAVPAVVVVIALESDTPYVTFSATSAELVAHACELQFGDDWLDDALDSEEADEP